MSNYDERMISVLKNIEALAIGLRHVEARDSQQSARLDDLTVQLVNLQQQVQKLTTDLAVLRARSVGRGPSQ